MSVQEVRAFNRFWTNLIGALDYGKHLYTPYTLTEARILYELARAGRLDAADLRTTLSMDAGYLSRTLTRFEQDGLVRREQSARDARRQRVILTEGGREAAALLEERSLASVGALLDRVPVPDRPRLTGALRTARELLQDRDQDVDRGVEQDRGADTGQDQGARRHADGARDRATTAGPDRSPDGDGDGDAPRDRATPRTARSRVLLRDPAPGDLGWIVERHGALYAAEYGWDSAFEGLVARVVADFATEHDPARERAWIAELDGRRVGSVLCVADEVPGTARLRLLLVEPSARGHGIGERLVDRCVAFAREAGYRELVLWTNSVLHAARRIYLRAGFTLVAEEAHHSYGADLVGQDWRLEL
jgi:DNA-binding MarR family transcriptional regulator/GNAT superfamily N-acetyltransferase